MIGRHSVMLKPDSVRRVTPPTAMIAKTRVEENRSHFPTEEEGRAGKGSTGAGAVGPDEVKRDCRRRRGSSVGKGG